MAGDWIKIRSNLDTDPNVVQVAFTLQIDEFSVVGRLHRFWSWANQHSVDGSLPGITAEWIDRYVSCQGFTDALRGVCWIDGEDGKLFIPRWECHNGESAKARAGEAIRKRLQRTADPATDKTIPPAFARRRIPAETLPPAPDVSQAADTLTRRASRPRDVEEALRFAATKQGYEEPIVREWFANRDRQNWETGGMNPRPITNWQSDLDAWVLREARTSYESNPRNHANRRAERASRTIPPVGGELRGKVLRAGDDD